ncbi:MAG: phosphoribosylamine--glycine ligase [Nitriliruptoraceae bacterium]
MADRILVIGSGAREHALAWRLAACPSVSHVMCAPGNPGMAQLGAHYPVNVDDPDAIADLAVRVRADLVVVGPEAPLVAGAVDQLQARGVAAFGPSAAAAQLEGSKAFAKQIMQRAGAPTGGYVATGDVGEAYTALEQFAAPYVVKADGLAGGKGVRICDTLADAHNAVDDALIKDRFGSAGATVVIEEFLAGPERSVFAICDGTDAVVLQPAQDYKRAFDGDEGPNTGGMGAYSPVPGFGLAVARDLADTMFRPVLATMADRGTPFRGLLYAGLVDTDSGPKLLEFNARFGDPETQVILPLIEGDFAGLLRASATGSVRDAAVGWSDAAAVTVVLAADGYPDRYGTGAAISGVDAAASLRGVTVFHAGTRLDGDTLVTAGGRVMSVTATAPDVAAARRIAYAAADEISWDGLHRREDIAAYLAGSA